MNRVSVLVAGDIHIGRVSSRVSVGDLTQVSARGAWDRLVDLAIREAVDLVCLTGDIADESNRFWEALGPLERGLRKLEENGIVTLAVSGNHDFDALPRLADQLESDSFRLLGRGGEWERYTLRSEGEPVLHVDGWSFPRERVHASPVDSYDLAEDPTTPTLVMVHGDLDVAESSYAPLPRQRMLTKRVAGWLLGHIHAPMVAEPEGRPFILYPGSPQALDPGEPGMHGVMVVEFQHGSCLGVRSIPLSTVRFDTLDIDVSGVEDLSALTMRVREQVEAFAVRVATESEDGLRHLVLRLTLQGQTSLAGELNAEAERIREDFVLEVAGISCSVDRVTLRVLPAIDLDALSRANSPPGMLASLLVELRQENATAKPTDRTQRLSERVEAAISSQRRAPAFHGIAGSDGPDDAEVRHVICEQAEALLIQLLRQPESP